MGLSKRSQKVLILVAVLTALPGSIWIADIVTPSIVRRALPATATDVHEYYQDDYFQGDFVRCLQAKMPEAEMPQFAAKLGLTQRYNARQHSELPLTFSIPDMIPWWHPPASLEGAYLKYQPGKESYSIARYQNGRVYFLAAAW